MCSLIDTMLPFQRNRLSLFTKFALFNEAFFLFSNYLLCPLLLHYSFRLLKCCAKGLKKIVFKQIWKLHLSSSIINVLRAGTTSYPSVSPTAPNLVRQEFNKYLPNSLSIYMFYAGYWARPWWGERRNQIQIFPSKSF